MTFSDRNQKKHAVNFRSLLCVASLLTLVACGGGGKNAPNAGYYGNPSQNYTFKQKSFKPYEINGKWYHPSQNQGYDETGIASWYGDYFHGRATATGETYDMNALSAAHKTLPLPSWAHVTNLENGKTIYLKINDRGPFVDGRIIDLSKGAAIALGTYNKGLGRVRVQAAEPPINVTLITPEGKSIAGSAKGAVPRVQTASATPGAVSAGSGTATGDGLPLYRGGGHQTYTREILMSGLRNPAPAQPTYEAMSPPSYTTASADLPNIGAQPQFNPNSPSPLSGSGNYRVQVGAFSSAQNAETLKNRIAGLGSVTTEQIMSANGGAFHRVTLDGYKSYAEAGQAAENLRQYGINDARIVMK